jgi:hypothetical protein
MRHFIHGGIRQLGRRPVVIGGLALLALIAGVGAVHTLAPHGRTSSQTAISTPSAQPSQPELHVILVVASPSPPQPPPSPTPAPTADPSAPPPAPTPAATSFSCVVIENGQMVVATCTGTHTP